MGHCGWQLSAWSSRLRAVPHALRVRFCFRRRLLFGLERTHPAERHTSHTVQVASEQRTTDSEQHSLLQFLEEAHASLASNESASKRFRRKSKRFCCDRERGHSKAPNIAPFEAIACCKSEFRSHSSCGCGCGSEPLGQRRESAASEFCSKLGLFL